LQVVAVTAVIVLGSFFITIQFLSTTTIEKTVLFQKLPPLPPGWYQVHIICVLCEGKVVI